MYYHCIECGEYFSLDTKVKMNSPVLTECEWAKDTAFCPICMYPNCRKVEEIE